MMTFLLEKRYCAALLLPTCHSRLVKWCIRKSDIMVRSHFNRLRESLCRDEEAALDTLTSHVNGRVATLNSYIERMDAISNKLNSTNAELQRSLVLDRSKLVERKNDLLALAESASMEEVRQPGD
ncbi:hypothetical protein ANCDUO_08968 [Ancylostoma duodenale]|uniref:Uncharacterized protein n=1 Tax=Ancylostoma duodenale TaxID=51022 RepID=A0A0C2CV26_9BILA|nr:hypothetical protein ANCDUO_08968 [Ancylostoma duodenale]